MEIVAVSVAGKILLADAERAGSDAYLECKTTTDNPYHPGTKSHDAWLNSFHIEKAYWKTI